MLLSTDKIELENLPSQFVQHIIFWDEFGMYHVYNANSNIIMNMDTHKGENIAHRIYSSRKKINCYLSTDENHGTGNRWSVTLHYTGY